MKTSNPKLTLFYISQSLAFSYCWVAIAIPYLLYRGLSPAQAFSLMAAYQFMGVILEYPTGVLGDRFGYRKVTYLANILNCLSMFVMSLIGGYTLYLFALSLLALGNSFSSGNDMGILKNISNNIKKDTANYNSLVDFVMFIAAIVGGYLSKYSYELALEVSGLLMLSANMPLYLLRNGINQSKNTNSVTHIIRQSFATFKNSLFLQIFILLAVFGSYSFSIKSIFGSFGNIYHIGVGAVGLIIGLGGLARSIGSKLYAEIPSKNMTFVALFFTLSIVLISMYPTLYVVVSLMLLNQVSIGYMGSKIDGDIHDLSSDNVRASLFSLKRLTMRLITSAYLLLYGYAIEFHWFSGMMLITSIFMMAATIYSWQYLKSSERVMVN